jgi:hypothetical protein
MLAMYEIYAGLTTRVQLLLSPITNRGESWTHHIGLN